MQSDDVKRMLAEAAAEPSRPLDAAAVVRRGRRQRRTRIAAAATGLAVVVAGASASLGTLGRDPENGPGPAGVGTSDPCDLDLPPAVHVVAFLREDASRAEAEGLRHALEQDSGVVEVRYVSSQEGYAELERRLEDFPGAHPVAPSRVPATLRIETVDESATRRLVQITHPAVDRVRSGLDARRLLCRDRSVLRTLVVTPAPSVSTSAEMGTSTSHGTGAEIRIGVLHAECGVRAHYASVVPEGKWCRFGIRVENEGETAVTMRSTEQVLHTQRGDFRPWAAAMEEHYPRRLFVRAIAPGEGRIGEVVFLLSREQVPVQLELHVVEIEVPVVFDLDYDCKPDLHEVRGGRCFFAPKLDFARPGKPAYDGP